MGLFDWAFKNTSEAEGNEIKEIFPLALVKKLFVEADILQTYCKILTDVAQRSHGLKEEQEKLLWDSCVQTNTNEGLITLLAEAMTKQSELFIVFVSSVGVIRKATNEEERTIREDYKVKGESAKGVFISFKTYQRTTMLKIYSEFEYCVLASLNKTVNIAKAVQFKIADLRKSVSLVDSNVATAQARSIAKAMQNGNDVLLDAADEVTTATPDTAPTEKAIGFLDAKRAFILSLPLAYVVGEQTGGLGSTGEADTKAIERGLLQYFVSIIRPVFKAVFKVEVTFKTEDFRQVTSGLEALKTFTLTKGEGLISEESMQDISARMFNLDPEAEKKKLEKEAKEAEAELANNPPKPTDTNNPPGSSNPPALGANPPAPSPAPKGNA